MEPTGYWTFFSNPKMWAIDEFLLSGEVYDLFSVARWQKDWFKKGQLGVIRVGHDQRTKEQLNGKKRLRRGIYAIIEILGSPFLSISGDELWLEKDEKEKPRYSVEIKYLQNLLRRPISLDHFREEESPEYDKYLVHGFQTASIPLNPHTFESIISSIGGTEKLEFEFFNTRIRQYEDIHFLERTYIHGVREVTEALSVYIEKSHVALDYQRSSGFKCEICTALGIEPFYFETPNGEYYAETHHVMPNPQTYDNSISSLSLITVCPNHHRQLHYGKVKLLENNHEKFAFEIDDEIVAVPKGLQSFQKLVEE
ncbi:hypothetical protein CVD25_19400 [Bacillus canaveralius]|uniref:Uncharacterized protein n=1 Tax=Bacillus canaveralius TaxID=1403243 RepID=A0A2N5GIL1_9BACI|nr:MULTISPECIES: HNH endonuclease signature motif containing protein [Bacillus]PLR80871.1 hypothetical protein CU635_16510 [Bacillus canaveralius]PLR83403.1 hypothetical protein CVD23_14500 [Bacillus sp. V33-4]PLR91159.1 hypothetical protein CVD25_19400 [Bacillus canaveralius]RSK51763.1 HNH endonuclease [Bacillus canaveralius]